MSNTNTNLQTQTSNSLHNAIIETGGKDRPPMLAPSNYNPPYKFKWTEKTVPVAKSSSKATTEGYMENYKNVSQDIRDHLNAEAEARDDTDDEPEDQELEAHYLYMAQIQEVTPDVADNSGPIFDAGHCKSYDRKQDDQDDNDDLAKERDLLASLIAKLKCEIDDSKNHLKKFQDELEKQHDVNYMSKVELDCAKAKNGFNVI
ncbi:hypothetical protein Tco_0907705 [Tanacetum coccineum]|uniref:Uncharacterized protein n=1 Tax=Tanacetum coccineum TaxID=301880 RepID=A0ABQ5CL74_9ASTR